MGDKFLSNLSTTPTMGNINKTECIRQPEHLPTAPAKEGLAKLTSSDTDVTELSTLPVETQSRIRCLKEEECKLNFAIVSGRPRPSAKPQARILITPPGR